MKVFNLGSIIVNIYIIKINDGFILIDTGYDWCYKIFLNKMKKYNISFDDIKYIFLTHAHDDHAGFLNNILYKTNAKLIIHKNAFKGLQRGQNSFIGGCSSLLAYMFCIAMKLFGKGGHYYTPIEKIFYDRIIMLYDENNSENKLKLENEFYAKIIETPGHTSCSMSLLFEDGSLFCGDAAMNGFPSINKVIIWIENLDCYYSSWKKIIELNPKKVYPSHGKPFHVNEIEKNIEKIKKIKLRKLK